MTVAIDVAFRFDPVEHMYTLRGKPIIGTTTALKVLSKELTWWASGMACTEFGWLHPKKNGKNEVIKAARAMHDNIIGMPFTDYLALLDKAYRAHNTRKETAKDSGKDMHSLLEGFIKCQMEGRPELLPDPRIQPFRDWAKKNVKRFLFSEMCCFSEALWCAGTADFGYEDMEGNFVLGDFKSSAEAYFSYWCQCGGYDLGISENGGFNMRGDKIFTLEKPFSYYAIFAERAGLDKPFIGRDTARLRRAFSYVVNLYREQLFFTEEK